MIQTKFKKVQLVRYIVLFAQSDFVNFHFCILMYYTLIMSFMLAYILTFQTRSPAQELTLFNIDNGRGVKRPPTSFSL